MKLRHNPELINARGCRCHLDLPNGVGLRDDPACEECGILICPTCTQAIPKRLILTVLALQDERARPITKW